MKVMPGDKINEIKVKPKNIKALKVKMFIIHEQ